jgi:hypothetical protein
MSSKKVIITVEGGCVTDVSGLPEDYDYEIVDMDVDEIGCYAQTNQAEGEAQEKTD